MSDTFNLDSNDNSSKSWYTKHRPKTFDEYSSDEIKKIVTSRFKDRSSMPHVIFISGTRGCGKTTFARLISAFYLCENPKEDGSPCYECDTCREIQEVLISGETGVEVPGVTEIDATIANGKDAIQEIMEDAMIAPMYTEYKVLIIDEVHMVTPQAQNSMLKMIEDIPPHLVVIFCTTNAERVLDTIKSRCQLRLEAKRQSVSAMAKRLMEIAEAEGLTVSYKAMEILAKKGDRVPRECINLLETVAKSYDGEVTVENIADCLGDSNAEFYIKYFEAANNSLSDILTIINEIRIKDLNMNEFLNGLMTFVLDALYIKHGINLEDYTAEFVSKVKKVFDMYESKEFDMLLQILDTASKSIEKDNAKKNEVTLLIAAMRISKIKMLASGLSEEQNQAVAENAISMFEHSKLIKRSQHEVSEQLKLAITPSLIKEEFVESAVVADKVDIMPSFPKINMEEMHREKPKYIEDESFTSEEEDALDSFFDED